MGNRIRHSHLFQKLIRRVSVRQVIPQLVRFLRPKKDLFSALLVDLQSETTVGCVAPSVSFQTHSDTPAEVFTYRTKFPDFDLLNVFLPDQLCFGDEWKVTPVDSGIVNLKLQFD